MTDFLQYIAFAALAYGWGLLLTDTWRGLRDTRRRGHGR
jgi:hypothetical protein